MHPNQTPQQTAADPLASATPAVTPTATPTPTAPRLDKLQAHAPADLAKMITGVRTIATSHLIVETGYGRHDDELYQGDGALICMAAQDAGWAGSIEVLARSGGILAQTRRTPTQPNHCKGGRR